MSESISGTGPHDPGTTAAVPRGLPLVVLIPGLTDAGSTVSSLDTWFGQDRDRATLQVFEPDEFTDYRARRPMVSLRDGKLDSIVSDTTTLSLTQDDLGNPFLLLSGPEPDYRWEEFCERVGVLCYEHRVSSVVILHAVPMPVPHTRDPQYSVISTHEDLAKRSSTFRSDVSFPGSLIHVLTQWLMDNGVDTTLWTLFVPGYLSRNKYPTSMLAAISLLGESTGLIFDVETLRVQAAEFMHEVSSQLEDNDEAREFVAGLEERFQEFEQHVQARDELLGDHDEMPTADEIADELERFLMRKTSRPGDEPQQ